LSKNVWFGSFFSNLIKPYLFNIYQFANRRESHCPWKSG